MANPTPGINPGAVAGIYKEAREVLQISEERFEADVEAGALDAEDPQVKAILESMGQLSTPNLARLSVGEPLVSYGPSYGVEGEEPEAIGLFLAQKRRMVQEGSGFTAAEMAGLAIPVYVARKDEAAMEAAGSESLQVRKHSRALSSAVTAHSSEGVLPVAGPVAGTVENADTKAGVLELVPVSEAGTTYHVEPVKTAGVNTGQIQVHIEAAPQQP